MERIYLNMTVNTVAHRKLSLKLYFQGLPVHEADPEALAKNSKESGAGEVLLFCDEHCEALNKKYKQLTLNRTCGV